jgi:hypothetical protein
MWPIEAKVLTTPKALAAYIRDVREQFLTCRYAPLSASGAMVGYLLSGRGADALQNLEEKLGDRLARPSVHIGRDGASSEHVRAVPEGKPYPSRFRCHHLMMEFPGVRRTTGRRK